MDSLIDRVQRIRAYAQDTMDTQHVGGGAIGNLMAIRDEADAVLAETRNDQAELKRLMWATPGAHFCNDWDGLLVWDGIPEAETCTCALTPKEPS